MNHYRTIPFNPDGTQSLSPATPPPPTAKEEFRKHIATLGLLFSAILLFLSDWREFWEAHQNVQSSFVVSVLLDKIGLIVVGTTIVFMAIASFLRMKESRHALWAEILFDLSAWAVTLLSAVILGNSTGK